MSLFAPLRWLGEDRQWFKARRGLYHCETDRDVSFCTHAIQAEAPFIVEDAKNDRRFSDNPLVLGEPFISSYAGIPLKTPEGYVVGTLCAIDQIPRKFDEHEITVLQNFAKIVVSELELRQAAATDSLTGTLSRGSWLQRSSAEIGRARRYDRPLSILMLDVDHFKKINDALGHPTGDIVLKRISELIMQAIRETDTLGRYGGEEFCVGLPETGIDGAAIIADRIRELVAGSSIKELGSQTLSVSVGISTREFESDDIQDLIARADAALYEAKNSGKKPMCCKPFQASTR